jgi:hypothetical protein
MNVVDLALIRSSETNEERISLIVPIYINVAGWRIRSSKRVQDESFLGRGRSKQIRVLYYQFSMNE